MSTDERTVNTAAAAALPRQLSPILAEFLIYHYAHADDIGARMPSAEAVASELISAGLVAVASKGDNEHRWGMRWRLTKRGRAYVDALLRVPLPVECYWVEGIGVMMEQMP